jgi:predicted nucleic acid-binding Zn ribbon protein
MTVSVTAPTAPSLGESIVCSAHCQSIVQRHHQAMASTFLLTALAAFVALLIARLNRIILVVSEPYPVYTTDLFSEIA